MNCPYCKADNNHVIDSDCAVETTSDSALRRRRRCNVCGRTFATIEEVYYIHRRGSKMGRLMDKLQYKRAVMQASNNSKFCKGVEFEVLGYSKTSNQYYVRPLEGTVNHWVDEKDLILKGE